MASSSSGRRVGDNCTEINQASNTIARCLLTQANHRAQPFMYDRRHLCEFGGHKGQVRDVSAPPNSSVWHTPLCSRRQNCPCSRQGRQSGGAERALFVSTFHGGSPRRAKLLAAFYMPICSRACHADQAVPQLPPVAIARSHIGKRNSRV